MDTAILIVAILTLLAAAAAAVFGWPAWRESQRKVALRLAVQTDPARPDRPAWTVVDNTADPGRRQVVFGSALYNDGDREARNWRVWLACRDLGTMAHLSEPAAARGQRSYSNLMSDGTRWNSEVLAASPADIVTRESPTILGDRNTLNFPGEPGEVYIDYRLDAEGMPTKTGVLRLDINWQDRTACFHVEPSSPAHENDSLALHALGG